jgi:hypothetical protein
MVLMIIWEGELSKGTIRTFTLYMSVSVLQ